MFAPPKNDRSTKKFKPSEGNCRLTPNSLYLAYNNLANIYSNSRYSGFNLQKSAELLQKGLSEPLPMRYTYEMRVNLGMIYRALGKKPESREILEGVLRDLSQESDFRFQSLKPLVDAQLGLVRQ